MRYKSALLRISCLLLISACSNTPPPSPELSFTRYQPIYMDVGKIEVIDEYRTPGHAPNVEQSMSTSPEDAMHIWAKDRLRAVGSVKSMQIIVHDGSVIATDLSKKKGMMGWLSIGNDKRYDAKLDVEIRIYGESAMSEASVNAAAKRTISIDESVSLAQRNATLNQMVAGLLEDINAELEKNMFAYFGNYISYSHTP